MNNKFYLNMRVNFLLLLGTIAVLLLGAEADSTSLFIGTKVAGFAIIGIAFALGRRWHRSGKIQVEE